MQCFVHFRSEKAYAITAGSFATVKREIGAREQAFGCFAISGGEGDANGHVGFEFLLFEVHGFLQYRSDPLREFLGFDFVVYCGLYDYEFIAAEPGNEIFHSRQCAQTLANRVEKKITTIVAERIVHLLEVIDINKVYRVLPAD
jgi:hypothetical protein